MEATKIIRDLTSTLPPSPCPDGNPSLGEECIEEREPEWLENEVVGMRVWQLVGIVLSIVLAITIMICCCVRFRIPRTKQEIEADYVRKKLTRSFRKKLAKINDKEMDEMDLRRALDRVRDIFDAAESEETEEKKVIYKEPNRGLKTKFNAMFQGIRVRFNREQPTEFNTMI